MEVQKDFRKLLELFNKHNPESSDNDIIVDLLKKRNNL